MGFIWRALTVLTLGALLFPTHAQDSGLPRTMAWSAYNLGTTGYNQAVAIGKVLRQHHGVTLRVLPGKNDVSRLQPLVKGTLVTTRKSTQQYQWKLMTTKLLPPLFQQWMMM